MRDYSPTLGRFTANDPLGFAAGDVNLYRYVGNGPTGRRDPSGLNPAILLVPAAEGVLTVGGLSATELSIILGSIGLGVGNAYTGNRRPAPDVITPDIAKPRLGDWTPPVDFRIGRPAPITPSIQPRLDDLTSVRNDRGNQLDTLARLLGRRSPSACPTRADDFILRIDPDTVRQAAGGSLGAHSEASTVKEGRAQLDELNKNPDNTVEGAARRAEIEIEIRKALDNLRKRGIPDKLLE
jgi:hypothetical protein